MTTVLWLLCHNQLITMWRTLMITVLLPLHCVTSTLEITLLWIIEIHMTFQVFKWQTTQDRQQKIQSFETVQLTRNPKKTIRFLNVRKFFHFFGSFRRTQLYLEIGPKMWTDSKDCHWDLWFYQLFRSWNQSKGEKKCTFFQRYLQIDMGSYFQKGSISK